MSRFEHPRGGRLVTGTPFVRDALSSIARQFPRPIQFSQLLDAAGGDNRAALARELLTCWMNGMIELYVDAPLFRVDPGAQPRTSAVARYLAAHGQAPINLRHESINVDPNQRRLIMLLDGTRTRDQLASEMNIARDVVDRALEALATVALLEG